MVDFRPWAHKAHDRSVLNSVQHLESDLQSGHDPDRALYDEVENLRKLDTRHGRVNFHLLGHDLELLANKMRNDGFLPKLAAKYNWHRNDSQSVPNYYANQPNFFQQQRSRLPQYSALPESSVQSPQYNFPIARPAQVPDNIPGATNAVRQPETWQNDTSVAAPPADNRIIPSDRLEQPEVKPRPSSTDGAVAQLRAAIQRANSGGRPVSILQYGDSHIAAGSEPKAIENAFRNLAPVDYHTKAKVGITAEYPLRDPHSWLDQPIQQANPDLVILSFGSNDSAGSVNKEAYEQKYQHLIDAVRQRAPQASILIVGPSDGHTLDGTGRTLPGLSTVVEAQQDVAARNGIGFFNLRAAMGGPGSIDTWYAQQLSGPDKLHFTPKGYQLIGQAVFNHLEQELS